MNITIILPDTVDPHMVDQLQAAVTRMGGQVAVEPEPAGPEEQVALDQNGQQGPVPEGMQQAPPMDAGSSGIKRPGSLRRPVPGPGGPPA